MNASQSLSVTEHFEELRKRIITSLLFLTAASVLFMFFAPQILELLKKPAGSYIPRLAFFSPEEPIFIYAKIGFSAGFIATFPLLVYELWAFLRPAMSSSYSRTGSLLILFAAAAFFAGCVFSYAVLLPNALKLVSMFASEGLYPVISASRYITFSLTLIIGCGLVFEMPILSFFLTKTGIINHKMMRAKFKYAFFIILVLAAIITPTGDALNMMILALPMIILYEASIWVSFFSGSRKKTENPGGYDE